MEKTIKKYKRRPSFPKTCYFCKILFTKNPKITHEEWSIRKFCSRSCQEKAMIGTKGVNTPHWKGDEIGYGAIHAWLRNTYGKANRCEGIENIVCKDFKTYEWAKLHLRDYKRNRSFFKMLCKSCHRTYDKTEPWNKGHHAEPKSCEHCLLDFIPFIRTRRFCSNSCSIRARYKAIEADAVLAEKIKHENQG